MNFIIFDVTADFAQIKKPFTTMSPQTYAIPTGTVVIGMISAIIGLDKSDYWNYFPANSYKLAISVRAPVKKSVIPINMLKTTSPKHFSRFEAHKRVNLEFVRDARYRIYFWSENDVAVYLPLLQKLQNHESHYTMSLGQSGNLANYEYIGLSSAEWVTDGEWVLCNSIIPKDAVDDIDFGLQKIFSNNIPVRMQSNPASRLVEKYGEFFFDSEGGTIRAKIKKYIKLDSGENIVPF